MFYEQGIVHKLYKKLLALYPQAFKEQLGESMEQTFNDLYKARQIEARWFGFAIWTFIETSGGIFEEHVLQIREGDIMQAFLTALKVPAFISFFIVLPFMIMEVANRRIFNEEFPYSLFGFLWLLSLLFLITMMPLVRTVQAGTSLLAAPVVLLLRVVFLAFIAWMWLSMVIDQMPCFLGVPSCD